MYEKREGMELAGFLHNKIYGAILLAVIAGEFLLPFVLRHFYPGYDWKTMAMSALGNPQSPVRGIYNLWLVWLGSFLGFTALVFCADAWKTSRTLALLELLVISVFAIGAGLLAGIFHVGETKGDASWAAKIHGAGSAVGFMALLFFPLLESILAFRRGETALAGVSLAAFLLALVCFTLFVMGDKSRFQNTVIACEGLWERAALLFMYMPFVFRAVNALLGFA